MLMISDSFIEVYDFVNYAGIVVHESRDRCQKNFCCKTVM